MSLKNGEGTQTTRARVTQNHTEVDARDRTDSRARLLDSHWRRRWGKRIGSIYPQLNLVAKPFVCPGGEMTYSQSMSTVGSASYYSSQWYCANTAGDRKEIDPNDIFESAGLIFGLTFFAGLLAITYFYWNSNIGPAKNGGPDLW